MKRKDYQPCPQRRNYSSVENMFASNSMELRVNTGVMNCIIFDKSKKKKIIFMCRQKILSHIVK